MFRRAAVPDDHDGVVAADNLLASQFAALEEPRDDVTIDVADRPEALVPRIREALGLGVRSDDAADVGEDVAACACDHSLVARPFFG